MVYRFGATASATNGSAPLAGPVRPGLSARASRAIALYELFAEQRPPGWPASGAAALTVLAARRRASVLAGDVARLLVLAKQMRAASVVGDAGRLKRLRRRARARAKRLAADAFRCAPRVETGEQRRRRVRDELLLAGEDPALWPTAELALSSGVMDGRGPPQLIGPDAFAELDGAAARAGRYRDELRAGVWTLPKRWRA